MLSTFQYLITQDISPKVQKSLWDIEEEED